MPIYEYRCEKCGQVSEFIILGKEERLQCKKCGSDRLSKMLSAHNVSSGSAERIPRPSGSCCGSPNSCGAPGSCCSK